MRTLDHDLDLARVATALDTSQQLFGDHVVIETHRIYGDAGDLLDTALTVSHEHSGSRYGVGMYRMSARIEDGTVADIEKISLRDPLRTDTVFPLDVTVDVGLDERYPREATARLLDEVQAQITEAFEAHEYYSLSRTIFLLHYSFAGMMR